MTLTESSKAKSKLEIQAELQESEAKLALHPDDVRQRRTCFELRCRLGDLAGAERLVQESDDVLLQHTMWKTLARLWLKKNIHAEAARCFEKAFMLNARDSSSGTSAATSWRLVGRQNTALQIIDQVLLKAPADNAARIVKAELLAEKGILEESIQLFEDVLNTGAIGNAAFFKWIELMLKEQRGSELEKKLNSLIQKNPKKHQLWAGLSMAILHRGVGEEAEKAATEAHTLAPDNVRYIFDLASVKRIAGKIEEAHELLEQGLKIQPDNPMALRIFGVEHKYSYGDAAFSRLNQAMAGLIDKDPKTRANLMFAMAKAFEDVGDYDSAFAYYAYGGAEKKKYAPFDERPTNYLHQVMIKLFQKNGNSSHRNELGCDSKKPVFILGMPRSGTSLLEQVLASHPDVQGVGEQKLISRLLQGAVFGRRIRLDLDIKGFWPLEQTVSMKQRGERYVQEVENIAGKKASRIVDKMPGNYTFVGPILEMMPNAYIIHSRRHPVETCLSNYRLLFTEGQLWSYDLKELGRAYCRYDAIMQHWQSLYGDRIISVRYEDMVRDLEAQAKRIISYLELPWNEACLRFFETERSMKTASASQVRKPIYTTSINRWRKYEAYLKPLLDELGPLVEQYEAELESGKFVSY